MKHQNKSHAETEENEDQYDDNDNDNENDNDYENGSQQAQDDGREGHRRRVVSRLTNLTTATSIRKPPARWKSAVVTKVTRQPTSKPLKALHSQERENIHDQQSHIIEMPPVKTIPPVPNPNLAALGKEFYVNNQ